MIALYFRYFLPEEWLKYVDFGAWFFALYGLYDWAFYLVFHSSGDFLPTAPFPAITPELEPVDQLRPLVLLRLKSCLGEPSFVAAVVIPYLLMAMEGKKRVLTLLLLASAILTTSTTVLLGLAISLFLQTLWSKQSRLPVIAAFIVVVAAIGATSVLFPETFRFLFTDKFNGDTDSGHGRLNAIAAFMDFFSKFNVLNWIFGVGFGYIYFSLGWSLTANTGLLGDGSFLYMLLRPAYSLPRKRTRSGSRFRWSRSSW